MLGCPIDCEHLIYEFLGSLAQKKLFLEPPLVGSIHGLGQVGSGPVGYGSGRIGSSFFIFWWVGLGRVKKVVGRVESGPENWTHGHLCITQDENTTHQHKKR